jgi:RNA polymerase sigma-B factor
MTSVATDTRELLRAYHEHGDERARTLLIEQHLPLVRSLAARYAGRGEQLDDLIQVGSIGLIKAADRFDLDRGVEFKTYAIPTILGELKRHFRDKGWAVSVPRRLKELSLRLNRLVSELGGSLGRSPTVAELAAAAGVEEEEVVEALEAGRAYRAAISLSTPDDSDDGIDPVAALGGDDPGYATCEDRILVQPALAKLAEREREIVRLRFQHGLTQSQIAAEVGVSQMHVSRLIRQSLEEIRLHLEPDVDLEVA